MGHITDGEAEPLELRIKLKACLNLQLLEVELQVEFGSSLLFLQLQAGTLSKKLGHHSGRFTGDVDHRGVVVVQSLSHAPVFMTACTEA